MTEIDRDVIPEDIGESGSEVDYPGNDEEFINDILERDSVDLQERLDYYNRYTTESIPDIDSKEDPDYIESDEEAPNYKIKNNFSGEIVDTRVNFLASNPIQIQYMPEKRNPEEDLEDVAAQQGYVDNFMKLNDFPRRLNNQLKNTGAGGKSAMFIYVSENENGEQYAKILQAKGHEYAIEFDQEGEMPIRAIRRYNYTDIDGNIVAYCELFDDTEIRYYRSVAAASTEDVIATQESWEMYREPTLHPFGKCPVIEFNNNSDRYPSFFKIIDLEDCYNRLFSNQATELQDFKNAYLVLENYLADSDVAKELRQNRIIIVEKDGSVKWLTKEIDPEIFESMKKSLEENIERFSGHVNYMNTDVFGKATNLSIQMRLQPLKSQALDLKLETIKAFNYMFQCLGNYWNSIDSALGFDWKKMDYNFTLAIPVNEVEQVKKFVSLNQNSVPLEDALRVSGIFDNPEEVAARAKKEQEEALGNFENEINEEKENGGYDL